MLASRLVIVRRAAVLLSAQSIRQQPRFKIQFLHPSRQLRPTIRAFSTQSHNNNNNTAKDPKQSEEQEDIKEKEEEKEEEKDEEKDENKNEQEEDPERKHDDTPIEEPGWKTARAGTFQSQKQPQQEVKISREFALLCWLLGLGGLSIGLYQVYKGISHSYREGQVDPGQLFRKVLESSIKEIGNNQKTIDKFFGSPSVVEEALANCQMFGNVTTLSFPLIQPSSAARLGTVYVDLVREEDTYEIRSAYVDSVLFGRTLDLIEAGIIKAEKYNMFDQEFSAQRTMELMQQAHEQLMQRQREEELAKAARVTQSQR